MALFALFLICGMHISQALALVPGVTKEMTQHLKKVQRATPDSANYALSQKPSQLSVLSSLLLQGDGEQLYPA